MVRRHRQQLTEILTNYGTIDMLCLDIHWGPKVWPQMRETILKLRELQPNVMLRNRGIGNYGDYYTPERGRTVWPCKFGSALVGHLSAWFRLLLRT